MENFELYEKCLIPLAYFLNKLHQRQYSLGYWNIVLGPWLKSYIYVMIKRYLVLQESGLESIAKKEQIERDSQLIVAETTDHYKKLLRARSYNQKLYGQIADFEENKINKPEELIFVSALGDEAIVKSHFSKRSKMIWMAINLLSACFRRRKKILLYKAMFSKKTRFKFILKSFFKFIELPNSCFEPPNFLCTNARDDELANQILAGDYKSEIEKIINGLVLRHLPKCYWEHFLHYESQAKKLIKILGNLSGIVSSNGWHHDEVFKQFCGIAVESGVKLYGIQHGGNYGNVKVNRDYLHECSIVDKYFTWGWETGSHKPPHIAMPVSKLIDEPLYRIKPNQQDILFAITASPYYDNPDSVMPSCDFEKYLNNQATFLEHLNIDCQKVIKLRPHHEHTPWKIRERLKKAYPWLQIEDWSLSFYKRIQSTKLYVCDHLSTTHIEALILGVPTILYWNPAHFPLTDEAQFYYSELKRVGVLYDCPILAAQSVSKIYPDVQSWWLEPHRQRAIKLFLGQFGKMDNNGFHIWFEQLMALA